MNLGSSPSGRNWRLRMASVAVGLVLLTCSECKTPTPIHELFWYRVGLTCIHCISQIVNRVYRAGKATVIITRAINWLSNPENKDKKILLMLGGGLDFYAKAVGRGRIRVWNRD